MPSKKSVSPVSLFPEKTNTETINSDIKLKAKKKVKEESGSKKVSFYNKYDLISLLIKSIRIGDKELAIQSYWLMKEENIPEYYIAKKLVQSASEDCILPEAFNYAMNAFLLIKELKIEENTLQRVILYLCQTEKIYHTEEEHYWELRKIQIREKTKQDYQHNKKPLELPDWIYDQYTAKGSAQKKRGDQIDRRFSGVYAGSGLFCRACYLKYQSIKPKQTSKKQAYCKHLEQCQKEKITIDDYLTKHKITIDEFLDIDNS
ncbi:MAG: hypothetical protein NTZ80_00915 [Patescibacteria group bacterium]|nr:hypothetical protein [Patescibacteria group bacterium]